MAWRRSKAKPLSTQRATASRSESWSSVNSKSMVCLRSAEDRLGDDVALHFVGPAVDRGLAEVEVVAGQRRADAEAGEPVALPAGFHRLAHERQRERPGGEHRQLGVALLDLAA